MKIFLCPQTGWDEYQDLFDHFYDQAQEELAEKGITNYNEPATEMATERTIEQIKADGYIFFESTKDLVKFFVKVPPYVGDQDALTPDELQEAMEEGFDPSDPSVTRHFMEDPK